MPLLNLALFQARPAFRSANEALSDLDLAMARAAAAGANLLVTPELYYSGYGRADTVRAAAQVQGSPSLRAVAGLAARHGVGLVLGYPEISGGLLYNSAAVFDSDGRLICNYRKVALPNDFERDCFNPGTEPEVFEFEGIRCSVLICYDIEFPELARRSAQLGTELLLVPTALRAKWRFVSDAIVPSRAYENAMFIGYCDFATDETNSQFSGTSSVCAPDGQHLCRAAGPEDLIFATIDTAAVQSRKSDFDFLQDLKRFDIKAKPIARIA
ncbi:nitrilase-related carbon-nitrogen hydrolase [Hoeflea alexandrii]|uniref:nitrilase-related carbon-nitrogen hydrolase n=1 Tax=Hoeflea alexandrii TaxID=288436 RepID=UPI0022AEC805|nr:nitrilase-related carbon-nitrogen hydrolase [Hoeflea alexandrii]MCZ4292271.1 carbon-nitrogen hydrolase [Hoeflea alexandrii]